MIQLDKQRLIWDLWNINDSIWMQMLHHIELLHRNMHVSV